MRWCCVRVDLATEMLYASLFLHKGYTPPPKLHTEMLYVSRSALWKHSAWTWSNSAHGTILIFYTREIRSMCEEIWQLKCYMRAYLHIKVIRQFQNYILKCYTWAEAPSESTPLGLGLNFQPINNPVMLYARNKFPNGTERYTRAVALPQVIRKRDYILKCYTRAESPWVSTPLGLDWFLPKTT